MTCLSWTVGASGTAMLMLVVALVMSLGIQNLNVRLVLVRGEVGRVS